MRGQKWVNVDILDQLIQKGIKINYLNVDGTGLTDEDVLYLIENDALTSTCYLELDDLRVSREIFEAVIKKGIKIARLYVVDGGAVTDEDLVYLIENDGLNPNCDLKLGEEEPTLNVKVIDALTTKGIKIKDVDFSISDSHLSEDKIPEDKIIQMIHSGLQSSCSVSISYRQLTLNVAQAFINTQVEISEFFLDFYDDAQQECKEAFKNLCEKGNWSKPFELIFRGLPEKPDGPVKELLSHLINERLKIRKLGIFFHNFPQHIFHEMLSKGIFQSDRFDLRLYAFNWKGAEFLASLTNAKIKFANFRLEEHDDQNEFDFLPLIASGAFNACKSICFPQRTKSFDNVLKAIASTPLQELECYIENDNVSVEAFLKLLLDEQNFKYLKVLILKNRFNNLSMNLFKKKIKMIRPKLIIE